jgi:hypothetical protein
VVQSDACAAIQRYLLEARAQAAPEPLFAQVKRWCRGR